MRNFVVGLLLLLTGALSVSDRPAVADALEETSPSAISSLKGIDRVALDVQVAPYLRKLGITPEWVKTYVGDLRKHGGPAVVDATAKPVPQATLQIELRPVHTYSAQESHLAVVSQWRLLQKVALARDPARPLLLPTWERMSASQASKPASADEAEQLFSRDLRVLTVAFLNDYARANPEPVASIR